AGAERTRCLLAASTTSRSRAAGGWTASSGRATASAASAPRATAAALPPPPASPQWQRHRLYAKIPAGRLHPGFAAIGERRAGNLAHLLAGCVSDFQLHLVGLPLHEPRNDGGLRRILAKERLVAPEFVIAIAGWPPIHRGRWGRE